MYSHYLIFSFFLSTILLPSFAFAQNAPDARCWTKQSCIEARKLQGLDETEAKEGFYTELDAQNVCGKGTDQKPVGFCLPSSASVTSISFGGKTEFANLGVFLVYMYRYAIIIASILAVIVIIFAGIQWIISAGSPEVIGRAKHRIGGALIGLVIAVLAYTILQTVNPALVNLRLPQTWMLNRFDLPVKWCYAQEKKLAEKIGDGSQKPSDFPFFGSIIQAKFVEKEAAKCGTAYISEANVSCMGPYCPALDGVIQVCKDKNPPGVQDPLNFFCQAGSLSGKIFHTSAVPNDMHWEDPWVHAIRVYGICYDGYAFEIQLNGGEPQKTGGENESSEYEYTIGFPSTKEWSAVFSNPLGYAPEECAAHKQLRGFALVGTFEADTPFESKDVEYRWIGKGSDSYAADLSLADPEIKKIEGTDLLGTGEFGWPSDSLYAALASSALEPHLITWDELRNGLTLDINASIKYFPEID